jgi:hypothetical protein
MSPRSSLWQAVDIVLPGPVMKPQTIPICKTNEPFKPSCEKLVEEVRNNLNEAMLDMALRSLQENFFSCLNRAPKSCLKHMFSDKVICLMATYQATFNELHSLSLTLSVQAKLERNKPVTIVNRYEGFALGETIDLEEAEV